MATAAKHKKRSQCSYHRNNDMKNYVFSRSMANNYSTSMLKKSESFFSRLFRKFMRGGK